MTVPVVAPPGGPRARPAPETAPTSRRPDLRVVAVPRRSRAGIYGIATVVVIFGTLFLNAGFHTMLVSGQQRLDSLNEQVLEQKQRNQRLRLQVAGLESPDRIVEAAKRDAMVLPTEVHWLGPGPGAGSAVASTSERVAPTTIAPTAPGATPEEQAVAEAGGTPVATDAGDR